MEYEILFFHQYGGVWSRHDTAELAQQHINTLTTLTSNNVSWTILCKGKEVNSWPEKKKRRS